MKPCKDSYVSSCGLGALTHENLELFYRIFQLQPQGIPRFSLFITKSQPTILKNSLLQEKVYIREKWNTVKYPNSHQTQIGVLILIENNSIIR